MPSSWYTTAAKNTGLNLWDSFAHFFQVTFTIIWDTGLTLYNLITPNKRAVPTTWPEYVPRKETDSRSPCPAFNALANHGIFPHDGRNITFKQMARACHQHFNFAPSFCFFVCDFMARILRRNYRTDRLDLGDMCCHNGIEHDGSITRHDTFHQRDQSIPAEDLINNILAASKDGKKLTAADLSRVLTERRGQAAATNGQFSLDTFHSLFGASNASTLLTILGGEVADIKPFLLEERLPQGWTSKVRTRMGLTMATFNWTSLHVLLGVDPSWSNAAASNRSDKKA